MSFVENLRRITNNLEDVMGVALAGMDGIVVEEHKRDSLIDFHVLAAEASGLMRHVDVMGESIQFGEGKELSVLASGGMILIKKVSSEYFLLMAVSSEGNYGKARYLLRREGAVLEKEL